MKKEAVFVWEMFQYQTLHGLDISLDTLLKYANENNLC